MKARSFPIGQFWANGQSDQKGERLGQGIFLPYLLADDEATPLAKRTGGFGSSGR